MQTRLAAAGHNLEQADSGTATNLERLQGVYLPQGELVELCLTLHTCKQGPVAWAMDEERRAMTAALG